MAETKTEAAIKAGIYPHFAVKNNDKPNKWLAFPLFGFLVKYYILLIPIHIWIFLLHIAFLFFWVANALVIFTTGRYWESAYTFILKFLRYQTKVDLYIYGLTDQYPWFDLTTDDLFELTIEKPEHPSQWFAFPLLGLIVRIILLIPFSIFVQIMKNGAVIAMMVSWFIVLFRGKFPDSLYEFEHDTIRLNLSERAYFTGLSDKYPNFYISMNHQSIKIVLLIIGTIIMITTSFINTRDRAYTQYLKHVQLPPNATCSTQTILQTPDFQKNRQAACSPQYSDLAQQAAIKLLGCKNMTQAKMVLSQACSIPAGIPQTIIDQNRPQMPNTKQIPY